MVRCMNADYTRIAERTHRLCALMESTKVIRVEAPAGTQVTLVIIEVIVLLVLAAVALIKVLSGSAPITISPACGLSGTGLEHRRIDRRIAFARRVASDQVGERDERERNLARYL